MDLYILKQCTIGSNCNQRIFSKASLPDETPPTPIKIIFPLVFLYTLSYNFIT